MFLIIRKYRKQINIINKPVIKFTLKLSVYKLIKRFKIIKFPVLKQGYNYYFIKILISITREGELKNNNKIK